jgi:SNF2 family DNA or RNA helicase
MEDANIHKDFYVVHDDNEQNSEENDERIDYSSKLPGNDDFTRKQNKFENLKRIVANRGPNNKFLIFSDFEQSFGRMTPYLDVTGLRYAQIKGNSVNETIRKYRANELDALLVNSRNYGSGLNLENTTDIILFHKFENQLEKQIIGRAQRPGRTSSLNVWYLLNVNEMTQVS